MAIIGVVLKKPIVLKPPRRTGEDAADIKLLSDYVTDLYNAFGAIDIEIETDDDTGDGAS